MVGNCTSPNWNIRLYLDLTRFTEKMFYLLIILVVQFALLCYAIFMLIEDRLQRDISIQAPWMDMTVTSPLIAINRDLKFFLPDTPWPSNGLSTLHLPFPWKIEVYYLQSEDWILQQNDKVDIFLTNIVLELSSLEHSQTGITITYLFSMNVELASSIAQ